MSDEATSSFTELPVQKPGAVKGASLKYSSLGRVRQPVKMQVEDAAEEAVEVSFFY